LNSYFKALIVYLSLTNVTVSANSSWVSADAGPAWPMQEEETKAHTHC
jgi:hypothetical protein